MTIRAVLFDWRGILVHDPAPAEWVREAFARLGRTPEGGEVAQICARLDETEALPEIVDRWRTIDCSAEEHRTSSMVWFALAGLDDALAGALYALDFDPAMHPFYPDVQETMRALRDRGIRVVVLSDIHVDLRPEFAAAGLATFVDTFVLSFERGVQKPDPAIFALALDAAGVAPSEALMVGDRASHDGGAVACGIPTLLLPPLNAFGPRGLDRVLALVDAP